MEYRTTLLSLTPWKPQVISHRSSALEKRWTMEPIFSFQHQITRVPYLPVEIVRTAAPTAPKGKKVTSSMDYPSKLHIAVRMMIAVSVTMGWPTSKQHRCSTRVVRADSKQYRSMFSSVSLSSTSHTASWSLQSCSFQWNGIQNEGNANLSKNSMELHYYVCSKTKRSNNILDDAMRIANQLFDRSSLNPGKKDVKIAIDKQGTAGTSSSIPKKVYSRFALSHAIDPLMSMIVLFEEKNEVEIQILFTWSKEENEKNSTCFVRERNKD